MRELMWMAVVSAALLTACASTPPGGKDGSSAPPREQDTSSAPSVSASPPEISPVLKQRATSALEAAVADPEDAEALVLLGVARRADARGRLEAGLSSLDGEVRFAAARGLRYLADPASADALVKAWADEKGWSVRKELALAASASGARALIPELKEALRAEREELRVAAAWALAGLGDPEGGAALERFGHPMLKGSPKPGTERWSRKVLRGELQGDELLAVRTLAELGAPEDVGLLAPLLSAEDPTLRGWAAAVMLRHAR